MNSLSIKKDVSRKDLLVFGLVVSTACFYFGAFKLNHNSIISIAILGLGALILSICVFASRYAKPLYLAWLQIGAVLGFINYHILSTVLFFLAIVPLGFAVKSYRKIQSLLQGNNRETASYRIRRIAQNAKIDMTKMY